MNSVAQKLMTGSLLQDLPIKFVIEWTVNDAHAFEPDSTAFTEFLDCRVDDRVATKGVGPNLCQNNIFRQHLDPNQITTPLEKVTNAIVLEIILFNKNGQLIWLIDLFID